VRPVIAGHPYLVGNVDNHPVSLVGGLADAVPRLALIATERLRDDHMWLRYAVAGS
jgi:hypothetical protein